MCSRGIDRGGVFADAAVVLVLGACGGVVLLSLPLSYLLSLWGVCFEAPASL